MNKNRRGKPNYKYPRSQSVITESVDTERADLQYDAPVKSFKSSSYDGFFAKIPWKGISYGAGILVAIIVLIQFGGWIFEKGAAWNQMKQDVSNVKRNDSILAAGVKDIRNDLASLTVQLGINNKEVARLSNEIHTHAKPTPAKDQRHKADNKQPP